MRILLVTGLVAGGVGRHVEQLAGGLAARGHRVVAACPASVAERFDLGVPVVDLPVGERPHPLRDRTAVATLRRAMGGADIVHAHGLRAGALAVLARLTLPRSSPSRTSSCHVSRPRLVVTTHNAAPDGTVGRAVYLGMEQLVSRGSDLLLGVSPDLVARAAGAGARRTGLAVVPATPASRTLDVEQVRARLRAELGLDGTTPLVVSAGRLARQKAQHVLVEAHLRLVSAWVGDTTQARPVLAIAGEGPERARLEQQIQEAGSPGGTIRLLGHRTDVPELLAAADLVVSTAAWEGQPVWLQEALQQGAPIVATDSGGTGVLLGDGALLVDHAHADLPAAVATAMRQVLTDPGLAGDLRRRAKARSAQLPTVADAVEAALAAYRA